MSNIDRPPSGAPPSYLQALTHQRIERGSRGYPRGVSYPGLSSTAPPARRPRSGRIRRFHLPSTSLSGSVSPEVVTADDSSSITSGADESTRRCIRLALPAMHICMAVTCLILNIIGPGIGSMVAGFGTFCCTRKGDWTVRDKFSGCGLCFLVGLAQIVLVPVILIGWIWSVIWGFALVGISMDDYHGQKDDDDDDESLTGDLETAVPDSSAHRRRTTHARVPQPPSYTEATERPAAPPSFQESVVGSNTTSRSPARPSNINSTTSGTTDPDADPESAPDSDALTAVE